MKTIVHRPARGLEGRDAARLRDVYARTAGINPDGVELDVRVTADGVPIVAHDPDLRLPSGMRRKILDLSFAELPPGTFLRLDMLMTTLSDYSGRIYVEIKDFREPSVRRVLDTLEPFRHRVWFISLPWKHEALRHILQRWQTAHTNLIAVYPALSILRRAHKAGISAVTFGWSGFNTFRHIEPIGGHVARFVREARTLGLEISAGLANSPRDLSWAEEMGFEMVWLDPHMLERVRTTAR